MARGKKRKRRTTKRRSTATTKPQSASRARAPEQVLAKAREERNPHVALEMYQPGFPRWLPALWHAICATPLNNRDILPIRAMLRGEPNG